MSLVGPAIFLGTLASALNHGAQSKNLKYQKWAQQETWKREDTAVQRLRAQMEASGFSPVLAAGQQAQTSAPVRTEAPQMSMDVAHAMMAAAQMQDQFETSAAQRALMAAQQNAAKSTAASTNLDAQIKDYDLGIAKKFGVPYSAPPVVKTGTSAYGAAKKGFEAFHNFATNPENPIVKGVDGAISVTANAFKGIKQKFTESVNKANKVQTQRVVADANQKRIEAMRRDAYLKAKSHKGGY